MAITAAVIGMHLQTKMWPAYAGVVFGLFVAFLALFLGVQWMMQAPDRCV